MCIGQQTLVQKQGPEVTLCVLLFMQNVKQIFHKCICGMGEGWVDWTAGKFGEDTNLPLQKFPKNSVK